MISRAPRRVTRVSAYAVCLDDEGRVLLSRIAVGHSVGYDGWWTLPGGGLDHGEDPGDAALRELAEETGLEGRIERLIGVHSWHTPEIVLAGVPTDYHGIRILYRVRVIGGGLRPEPDGGSSDEVRWFVPGAYSPERVVDLVEIGLELAGPHRTGG